MKIIIVTGTPGTGKSSVSRGLFKVLECCVILDIARIVLAFKLYESYDPVHQTFDVDPLRVRPTVSRILRHFLNHGFKHVVVDTVIPDVIPPDFTDNIIAIVVLRTDPLELARRLSHRRWPIEKYLENIEAELVGSLTAYVREIYDDKPIVEVDTTGRSVDDVCCEILSLIKSGRSRVYIDWLAKYDNPLDVLRRARIIAGI